MTKQKYEFPDLITLLDLADETDDFSKIAASEFMVHLYVPEVYDNKEMNQAGLEMMRLVEAGEPIELLPQCRVKPGLLEPAVRFVYDKVRQGDFLGIADIKQMPEYETWYQKEYSYYPVYQQLIEAAIDAQAQGEKLSKRHQINLRRTITALTNALLLPD